MCIPSLQVSIGFHLFMYSVKVHTTIITCTVLAVLSVSEFYKQLIVTWCLSVGHRHNNPPVGKGTQMQWGPPPAGPWVLWA